MMRAPDETHLKPNRKLETSPFARARPFFDFNLDNETIHSGGTATWDSASRSQVGADSGHCKGMETGYQSFMKNRYWILRHGKSIPNERGLIVSSLENGILEEYQLASDGVHQARLAGESFLKGLEEENVDLENVRICYSPFSRTVHTARVVASVLNIPFEDPRCKVIPDIRERFFGPSYELKSHDKYPEIWALDENNPFMQPEGGESVADVAARLTRALAIMESEFAKCAVLVVSHGDPLQILQTILNATKEHGTLENDLMSRIQAIRVPSVLSQHRKFALDTGELRQLV